MQDRTDNEDSNLGLGFGQGIMYNVLQYIEIRISRTPSSLQHDKWQDFVVFEETVIPSLDLFLMNFWHKTNFWENRFRTFSILSWKMLFSDLYLSYSTTYGQLLFGRAEVH